jgi:hypothetical protein
MKRSRFNGPVSSYTSIYQYRKAYEDMRNTRGDHSDRAYKIFHAGRFDKNSRSYATYSKGMLAQRHIDVRARRWTVKVFLSHAFEVLYYERHGVRPTVKPYVLDVLGKRHEIVCPKWPFKGGVDAS